MGYTHYWRWLDPPRSGSTPNGNRGAEVVRAMKKIIRAHEDTLDVEKVCSGVGFNGIAPDDHETFVFPGAAGFNFCKTAHKPYDIVVVACLAVAAELLGDVIKVSSDGTRADWKEGVELASKILGRAVPNPIDD